MSKMQQPERRNRFHYAIDSIIEKPLTGSRCHDYLAT